MQKIFNLFFAQNFVNQSLLCGILEYICLTRSQAFLSGIHPLILIYLKQIRVLKQFLTQFPF